MGPFEAVATIAGILAVGFSAGWALRGLLGGGKKKGKTPPPDPILAQLCSAANSSDPPLWKLLSASPPKLLLNLERRPDKKVLAVVNAKGGVGKTTLAIALGAFFETELGKSVLFVDNDFQGSMTSNLLNACGETENHGGVELVLRASNMDEEETRRALQTLRPVLQNARILGSKFSFADHELKLWAEWWAQCQDPPIDNRFLLKNAIHTAEALGKFDIIIIDTPPTFSMGTINALVASDHFLVPTGFDMMAVETLGPFLDRVREIKNELNADLDFIGAVRTLVPPIIADGIRDDIDAAINDGLSNWGGHVQTLETRINRVAAVANAAGETIDYVNQPMFKELGKEVASKMGIKVDKQ